MFSTIFNPNNLFFRFTDRVLDIAVLSILWLVCSLPIVTIGAASTALYYSCAKCLRYKEPKPYRNFVYAFKQNFFTSTLTWLIYLVLLTIIIIVYVMLELILPDILRVTYLVFMLIPIGVISFTFPLLSRFDYKASSLLKSSLQLSVKYLARTLALAVLVVASTAIILFFWYCAVMLVVPGLCGLLSTYLLEPIFRIYTKVQLEDIDDDNLPWYQK